MIDGVVTAAADADDSDFSKLFVFHIFEFQCHAIFPPVFYLKLFILSIQKYKCPYSLFYKKIVKPSCFIKFF